jgi:hypothetical protein
MSQQWIYEPEDALAANAEMWAEAKRWTVFTFTFIGLSVVARLVFDVNPYWMLIPAWACIGVQWVGIIRRHFFHDLEKRAAAHYALRMSRESRIS